MNKMNVAVIGLGMEGKKAVKALLDYGNHVYASDLNENIETEFIQGDLELELGNHNMEKIAAADAVVLSPSLWDKNIAKKIMKDKKLLSDVLTAHKSIFTIGVTGTNGKTTTCHMIRDIFQKSDMKVLLGGNAGGGFEGYTKLVLEASQQTYDILVVEVCDMTLDFASYFFEFDMVVVTNIGNDHMNHHGSLDDYTRSVCKFLDGKKLAVLNENDNFLHKCSKCADETYFFDGGNRKLKLFGNFNQENASAASKVAELVGVSQELIDDVLSNFTGVEGRTTSINFNDSNIIIGKTDNPDAAAAVFSEVNIEVMMIGTPRKDETCRYNILKEVKNANPIVVVLFPGLDTTTDLARKILIDEGYDGKIYILNEVSEVVKTAIECAELHENIFIGGNGQKKIMQIYETLKELSKNR